MINFNLSSTPLNEIQNHEDYKIVWFSTDSNIPYKEQIIDYLIPFNSFEDCDDYIINVQSDRKILLVLINFFEYVSYYNDFPQIQSIYVLERNLQNINYENQTYSKRVNTFTNEHALIERLRQDILLTYRNDLSIKYQNEEVQLNSINDFENNCTLDDALYWYTKEPFVYKLVNKAFRTRNVDLICRFRYFIILLHRRLKELSIQQQKINYTIVYRAQTLRKNDLETLKSNIGNLISTNTIMSTTRNKNVADMFLDATAEINVIFKINIENATDYIFYTFADISEFSQYPQEEETLFFPGSVFHIDSVEKENNSTWIIKLTLNNDTTEQIEQLMNVIQKQFTNKINLDYSFMKIDDFNLFRKYYRILTNKKFTFKDAITNAIGGIDFDYLFRNFDKKFIVFNILIGNNYFRLFEYDNALHHYDIAISSLDNNNNNNQLIGEIYNHIGDVQKAMNNFQSALLYYEKALQIFTSHNVKDRYFSSIYRKISDVYQIQNKNIDAIIYEGKANQIDKRYRQRSELDHKISLEYYQNQLNTQLNLLPHQRADILYSIGVCLIKKCDYQQALENLLQAKKLFENHLPTYDHFAYKFGTLFECIALVYFLLKDYFNALIMWKRALDIRTTFI
ncbi:unnamed protein product [Rotaria sordida]|uniref:NAD(P)(+)--arginine ADP-ribosyltransferase n=1 Tax=Rotaria sordida TaxID=392033 RepID=A0A820B257_9BILA|nr:unnamed protein product [Rotaria sordida]